MYLITLKSPSAVRAAGCLVPFWCGLIFLTLAELGFSQEGERTRFARRDSSASRSRRVSNGFVWVDGAYVAPPYIVEQHGNELSVNGHSFQARGESPPGDGHAPPEGGTSPEDRPNGAQRERRENAPFSHSRRAFGWRRWAHGRWGPGLGAAGIHNIARVLGDGGAMVVCDGEFTALFSRDSAVYILATLLSDTSNATSQTMEDALLEIQPRSGKINLDQWRRLIDAFEPTAELRERAEALIESQDARNKQVEAQLRTSHWYQVLASKPVRYAITVTGMVLAVVALGNLLLYRPSGGGQWSDVTDGMAEGLDMRRIVILLGLLGGFDLLLTLAAQQAGGFMELNPLGSRLITSPLGLAAFKVTSLIVACSILLRLRHYRGAQIASWWLCMICTILTFRWVTFNSLFMT